MSSSMSQSLGKATDASKTFAVGLLAGGTALAGLGAISLNAASDAEQAQTAFTTMLGSAEKAQSFIADMKKFAADTPFETTDISKAAQTMLSFGIASEDVMGNIKMLGDVAMGDAEKFQSLSLTFAQVQSSGKLMGGDLLQMIGQGFNPLQIMAEKTGKSMADLKKEMENGAISADMVKDAFKSATSEGGLFYGGMEAQSKTFAGTMSTLQDAMTAQFQVIGEKLLPVAKQFVDVASGFIQNTLPVWIQKTQELVNWFGQHQQALFILAGAIMGALVPAMWAWAAATATAAFNMAVALAPFIIGGAIIGGLIAGILWIKNNWEMIASKATEIWTGIASFFQQIWDRISSIFNFATSVIAGIVVTVFNAMGVDIVGIWNATWLSVSSMTTATTGTIKNIINAMWTWIQTSFKTISEPLGALWKGMWEGMGGIVTGVWETVKTTIKNSINWIIDQINNVIRSINSVAEKGAGTLGISSVTMGTIPRLANGGIVTRPTIAMIGEAGPEAIIPLGKGRSAGGANLTINITGNTLLDRDSATKMGDLIIKQLKLNNAI